MIEWKLNKERDINKDGERLGKRDFTYDDSSNRVHPVIKIICQQGSNETNNIGDNIEEMVLGISFDNLIHERPAIKN